MQKQGPRQRLLPYAAGPAMWSIALLATLLLSASIAAAGKADDKPKISQVFFAQHHVLSPESPYFTLTGNLEALIKVHLDGPKGLRSPEVLVRLSVGPKTEELELKGPRYLPGPVSGEPALMQHQYEDCFTAVIPKQWVRPGLRVTIELRGRREKAGGPLLDRKTTKPLPVGAPTRLLMTMFDFHFFGGAKGADYPSGWFEEMGAKLPVAELELRRVRNILLDKLVMPPRGGPAVLCGSRAEYQKKTGQRFDGEQDVAGRWNAALKHAAGAGWGGVRRLYYSNIYGVHSGGTGGGLSGRGNGRSPGILLHELGHAFGLPHWAGKAQYPYVGEMHGIPAPGGGAASPHVGPTWGFDLRRRAFISPIANGCYKNDPMQGGGRSREQGYIYAHFSDYSVHRIRGCLERTQVIWNEQAGAYTQWDPATGSYSKVARRLGGPNCPVEDDVDVISVLFTASLVTPEANIVYPPIGPYKAGRLEVFDATTRAGHWGARQSGYDESNCNTCLRVTQGGKVRTYLLKDGLSPKDDPKAWDSLCIAAINLPARDGAITQADLLLTPSVLRRGVAEDCKVLYRWKPPSKAYKTQTVTALYPTASEPVAAPQAPTDEVAEAKPARPALPMAPERLTIPDEPQPKDTRTDEQKAASLLRVAKLLLANIQRSMAVKKLKKLVETYPETPAAQEAQGLLKKLGQ